MGQWVSGSQDVIWVGRWARGCKDVFLGSEVGVSPWIRGRHDVLEVARCSRGSQKTCLGRSVGPQRQGLFLNRSVAPRLPRCIFN